MLVKDIVTLDPEQGKLLNEYYKKYNLLTPEKRVKFIIEHNDRVNRDNSFPYDFIPGLSTDDLIKALYIGYEVEQTPGEQLFRYYKDLQQNPHKGSDLKRESIKKTLEILGLKVEGIN